MSKLFELWSLLEFLIVQGFGIVLAGAAAVFFLYLVFRKHHTLRGTLLLVAFFSGVMLFFWFPVGVPKNLAYPFGITTYGPAEGPTLPLSNVIEFFMHLDQFPRVADIARDPSDLPPPIDRAGTTTVEIHLTAEEVLSSIAPGVVINYWTFDGKVPGPFLRVKEGDTVKLTLTNASTSLHSHSIDLHAVTGPGGGAAVTTVMPGESKTLTFSALNPGLFVYHCAFPNAANHMAHGMYGLILVEPKEGLPKVDKEFYVMQGEWYTAGARGTQGLQVIDTGKMLDGDPTYVVFNGKVKSLTAQNFTAQTGQQVRIFFGNGGVNLDSNLHMIGEIFDTVYPEASIGGSLEHNVQTTLVPAGGATIVQFGLQVPGNYMLVDHALARMDKGAWGMLIVSGDARKDLYDGIPSAHSGH